jgi:two-component system cell cycle sensor histidine kinase/response regulator CckA
MNLFAFSGILLGTTCLILLLIIGLYGKTRLHRIWFLFNVAIALWGFGAFFVGKATTPSSALASWKFAHIGIIFISVFFYHTMSVFCDIEKARRPFILFAYLQGFFFLILDISNHFITTVTIISGSLYFYEASGLLYALFLSLWIGYVVLGHYELIKYYRTSSGYKKNQSLYFFIGTILGFSGGATNFLPAFGLNIPPIGNFTIPLYCLICTYAILRFRLMDFHVVLKKSLAYSLSVALLTGLFLVLVFTVTKYFSEMTGMTSFTITAIYTISIAVLFTPLKNRIQLFLDRVFHKAAYDYYAVVKKISYDLVTTIGLQPTYRIIADTIFTTLKLRSAYLLSAGNESFETVYAHTTEENTGDGAGYDRDGMRLPKNAEAVRIAGNGTILVRDELQISHDENTAKKIDEELKPFEGRAVVPMFVEKELAYLLVLGEKLSTDAFNNEDIDLLTTIANQASIALKNAKLYHELEQRVQTRTSDFSKAIEKLHKEITERKRIEEALQAVQKELEQRVQERTAELRDANMKLMLEVIERMKVETAVRTAAEQWRATFDSMKDAIIMLDNDDKVIRVNKACTALFNNEYGAIIDKPLAGLFQTIGMQEEIKPLARLKNSKQHEEGEVFLPEKNRWFVVTSDPVVNEDRVVGAVCVLTDISGRKKAEEEKKKLEEQLMQTQKMESIGRLAGGIAHDFNNLLSAIIGYSELNLAKLPDGSDLRENMQIIKDTGEKAAGLTRQLLAFSRKQILEMKDVDLGGAVANMAKILSRLIGEDIAMDLRTSGGVKNIRADQVQIEQIIMNLVVNARDSMPKGGKITIETSDVWLDEASAIGPEKVLPGPYVMLSVNDTGQGMTKEVKERIFEPFFTTKDKGKGTGMGLATVYGIVLQHKGYITVDSEQGKGTTFRLYFPVATVASGEADVTKNDHKTLPRGNETILVVDDEPVMAKLVMNILQPLGYTILQTAVAQDALRLGDTYEGVIDLLLTDVIMPEMNGKQLADIFLYKRPGTAVMYMSGYTDDVIGLHGILEQGIYFIQKPLNTAALASKIRDVLDKRRERGEIPLSPEDMDPMHVLLVDDEKVNRDLIRRFLHPFPITFDEAENGNRAIEMFSLHHYDLVLMDLNMPQMDGLAATAEIRTRERSLNAKPTPVIAVTGSDSQDDTQKCAEAGCTRHLAKPIRKEKLIKTVIPFARKKQDTALTERHIKNTTRVH